MSEATPARPGSGRMKLFATLGLLLVMAFVVAMLVLKSAPDESASETARRNAPFLESGHAPQIGSPDAKVHIVEFFDPACEACAAMSLHVKKLMADNPGRIRLSVRHVPFHQGADQVVRVLEAARGQDKYWETLDAAFRSQDRWTVNHRVLLERLWPQLEGLGLDLDRVRREMRAADIDARLERDMADAKALIVTKTPEYFVNGRPLPQFGLMELKALVREELARAYP